MSIKRQYHSKLNNFVYLLSIVVFLVSGLYLRLYQLGEQSLWLDEGTSWKYVSQNPIGVLFLDLFRPSQAYPLFHILLKVAIRLLGDSEWVLRLPSAIAGGLAVPVMFCLGYALRGWVLGLSAAGMLLVSPFAISQAQDAKVYSLVLLIVLLLAWSLIRIIEKQDFSSVSVFLFIVIVGVFTHRFILFSILGCVVVWVVLTRNSYRYWILALSVFIGVLLVIGLIALQDIQNAGGQFNRILPHEALWLTLGRFSFNLWPGEIPLLWLMPFTLLFLFGLLCLFIDIYQQHHYKGAITILVLFVVPMLIFGSILYQRPLYEPRYLTSIFPFCLLILAWSVPEVSIRRWTSRQLMRLIITIPVWGWVMLVTFQALYLPERGVLSGDTIKEDYRSAVRHLARYVHPTDMVLIYPDSVIPLYEYYAPRVVTFALPQPYSYPQLGRAAGFKARELDMLIRSDFQRYKRAWLLIAPDHARLTDPPEPGDEVGLIGLAFQYGMSNGRLPCGPQPYTGFVGVRVYCNVMPKVNDQIPQPAIVQPATFGDAIRLRGYSIEPVSNGIRAGQTLPITLFWETVRSLEETDYQIFVHLTSVDNPTPLAQVDGRFLEGGLPSSLLLQSGEQIHDERTMVLPEQLAPGQYVLRLGVVRTEDLQSGMNARLSVHETTMQVLDDAVVLGVVEVK
jgi:NADH:ubiquinone oxidoreductase subunit 6 (subunit J)